MKNSTTNQLIKPINTNLNGETNMETTMNRQELINELDDIHTKYRHLNNEMCDIKSYLAKMKVDPKLLEQMFLNPEDIDRIFEENSREPDPIDIAGEDQSYQLDNIYQTNLYCQAKFLKKFPETKCPKTIFNDNTKSVYGQISHSFQVLKRSIADERWEKTVNEMFSIYLQRCMTDQDDQDEHFIQERHIQDLIDSSYIKPELILEEMRKDVGEKINEWIQTQFPDFYVAGEKNEG